MSQQEEFIFHGAGYNPERDHARLAGNMKRILRVLLDNPGTWFDLNNLAHELDLPHASVTACVRGLRLPKNGGHVIDSRRRKEVDPEAKGDGTWLYKLVTDPAERAAALARRDDRPKIKIKDVEKVLKDVQARRQHWDHPTAAHCAELLQNLIHSRRD